MIVRLILLIIFVIVIISVLQLLKKTPQSQLKNMYLKIGLGALALALILLAVTGRIHWIGAAIGALIPIVRRSLPLLIRFFPMLQNYFRSKPKAAPSVNNCSEVKTAILSMVLNHDTNHLDGEVISGPLAGSQLDSLQMAELNALLDYCHREDSDSVKLLINYLNHRFGSDWQSQPPSDTDNEMTEQSALNILGLKHGASKDEIIKTHRKLMQKLHPDRGGSDFLAAQINAAKDLLISKLS